MRRVGSAAVLALLVSACAPTTQERIHEFNEEGVQRLERGDFKAAREEFQAALMLQPENPRLIYNLGQCYDRLGQTSQAEQSYRDALRCDPDYAECRHALDAILVNSGRIEEAHRMVQDWLSRKPGLAAAYAEDGWLYYCETDPDKALKRYQQALDLDPHDNRALLGMAQVYEEQNRPDRALHLYLTALDFNPRQPEVVKRANLLRKRGVSRPHPDS
jgi:Tfp pilus assembly protein PilF